MSKKETFFKNCFNEEFNNQKKLVLILRYIVSDINYGSSVAKIEFIFNRITCNIIMQIENNYKTMQKGKNNFFTIVFVIYFQETNF